MSVENALLMSLYVSLCVSLYVSLYVSMATEQVRRALTYENVCRKQTSQRQGGQGLHGPAQRYPKRPHRAGAPKS